MEDEIDLRSYVAALLKYKYWIIGTALIAAVAGLVVSLLLPPVYQATALVAVIAPRYTMQFDPRVETSTSISRPYRAYPALAVGDEVLAALSDELGADLGPSTWTVTALRKRLTAVNATDLSMIELRARTPDPASAAQIVNRWAQLFVERANDLYGQDKGDLAFFEAQLAEAEAALSKAEQDQIAFQSRNESAILRAQLDSQQATMEEYLKAIRSLRLIVQDARSLQERLGSQDSASRGSLGDDLTSLFLEVDALNRGSLPIQLMQPCAWTGQSPCSV